MPALAVTLIADAHHLLRSRPVDDPYRHPGKRDQLLPHRPNKLAQGWALRHVHSLLLLTGLPDRRLFRGVSQIPGGPPHHLQVLRCGPARPRGVQLLRGQCVWHGGGLDV